MKAEIVRISQSKGSFVEAWAMDTPGGIIVTTVVSGEQDNSCSSIFLEGVELVNNGDANDPKWELE